MITPENMRHTLAGFATGLSVVATEIDGKIVGMPVNSLGSVSLDPPLVSLAFDRTSTTWPRLRQSPRWGISVLAEGMETVAHDLRRPASERFDNVNLEVEDGAAYLTGALATLTVTPRSEIEAGDHTLVLLDVLSLDRDDARAPLVFFGSQVRTLAS